MIARELSIEGAFVFTPERRDDERGSFARTFCADELGALGLETNVAQISSSSNARRGTLRGMHLQLAPHEETKVVRCTRGAIYDVIVDLRPASGSFGRWEAVDLSLENGRALYVPRACAHGFLSLEDDTDVEYVISAPYRPEAGAGIRWDDPAFGIEWPFAPVVMNDRDRSFPDVDLARIREHGLQPN